MNRRQLFACLVGGVLIRTTDALGIAASDLIKPKAPESRGVLWVDKNPMPQDTVLIGGVLYHFEYKVQKGEAEKVCIGVDVAETVANFRDAIKDNPFRISILNGEVLVS